MSNQNLCVGCGEVVSDDELLSLEVSECVGCPGCHGLTFAPLLSLEEMPKTGGEYFGKSLGVDLTNVQFSDVVLMLGGIAAGGYVVKSKFIGSWDFMLVTATSKRRWWIPGPGYCSGVKHG